MASDFEFKVNGVEIRTEHQSLSARAILELAEEKGAMSGKPDDYILQGDKGKYKKDDSIDLKQDNLFITIPDKPTPVAN